MKNILILNNLWNLRDCNKICRSIILNTYNLEYKLNGNLVKKSSGYAKHKIKNEDLKARFQAMKFNPKHLYKSTDGDVKTLTLIK
jgi:hypothetical protein